VTSPQVQTTLSGPNGKGEPQVILSTSPVSGAVLGRVTAATPPQIAQAMQQARVGRVAWEGIGLRRRLVFVRALRDALYHSRERILATMVAEQGKVYQEALLEYLTTLEIVDVFLRQAARVLGPQPLHVRLVPTRAHAIERRPFGVVLVIAPWNYPLALSLTPIAAALVAGNSVVYKPSEYATQVGEVIAGLVAGAGIPPEVFHILHGHGDVGAALIEAGPDRICFTGSVATGRKVAQAAARRLIPATLELGGKDAAIVLEDADLRRAAVGVVWGGMFNAGQTCASVERVLVQRRVADRFVAEMRRVVDRYLDCALDTPAPALGAISTPAQIEIVDAHVTEALRQGARAVTGGRRLNCAGRFFAPTILTDVTPDMRVFNEETFGPVIAVMTFGDEAEAIRIANAGPFGLTASVWTRNRARGLRIARQLEAGTVSVNEHMISTGLPEAPWGGVKASGYGRTRGAEGLLEMTYAQVVTTDRIPVGSGLFQYPYTPLKRALMQRAIHLLYGPTWRDRLRAFLP